MKLDSRADVIIVHRDPVHPSKIKTNDQLQLECVHGNKVSNPIASVSIQINKIHKWHIKAINDEESNCRENFSKLCKDVRSSRKRESGAWGPESLIVIVTMAWAKRQREQEEEESRAERDCGVVPK